MSFLRRRYEGLHIHGLNSGKVLFRHVICIILLDDFDLIY
jgi:hypothetical protein